MHGTTVGLNAFLERKGTRRAARHDRGAARRLLDRPPRPQGALRAALPQARAARAAARRRRGRRAPALGRLGRRAARSGERRAAGRRGCATTGSTRSPSACSTPTSTPRTSSSCASCSRGELPRALDHALARDRARVARVRARLDRGAERLHRAAGRALPRARSSASSPGCEVSSPLHVMQSNGGITTARSARERADPDAALRPGRRDDRRRRARPRDRPAEPALHRHGRHLVRRQPRRRRPSRPSRPRPSSRASRC